MNFAIMRCKKLKAFGNIAASLQHTYRERPTHNADSERTPDNNHWHGVNSTDEAMGKLRSLLPEKRRKDAVLCVEYLMTASPEFWQTASKTDQQAFFDQAHRWLAKKYGHDRIISAVIHNDEKSPHMAAHVVPLTPDGRLSAKQFIGNREQMSQDQTSFAQAVQNLGLERGIKGSKAKHQTIRAYYAALNAEPKPHLTVNAEELHAKKTGMFQKESSQHIAKRITQRIQLDDQPRQARLIEAKQTIEQNQRLRNELGKVSDLRQAFSELNHSEQHEVLMAGIRASHEKQAKKQRDLLAKKIELKASKQGKSDDSRYALEALPTLQQHGIEPSKGGQCLWMQCDARFTLKSLVHHKKPEHIAMTLNRMSPRYIQDTSIDKAQAFVQEIAREFRDHIYEYQMKYGIKSQDNENKEYSDQTGDNNLKDQNNDEDLSM